MTFFSKKILLLSILITLHSCGDNKNLNESEFETSQKMNEPQADICSDRKCNVNEEEQEKERARLVAEEEKIAKEKEEQEKERARLVAEEAKIAKEKEEQEKERARLVAEEAKSSEKTRRIEEEKRELEELYKRFSSTASVKFNWKNVKEAAAQFVKIKVPNSKNLVADEYELETEKMAAKITKVIFYLDINKAKVNDACYSNDISEIQNKCVPNYYSYARTL